MVDALLGLDRWGRHTWLPPLCAAMGCGMPALWVLPRGGPMVAAAVACFFAAILACTLLLGVRVASAGVPAPRAARRVALLFPAAWILLLFPSGAGHPPLASAFAGLGIGTWFVFAAFLVVLPLVVLAGHDAAADRVAWWRQKPFPHAPTLSLLGWVLALAALGFGLGSAYAWLLQAGFVDAWDVDPRPQRVRQPVRGELIGGVATGLAVGLFLTLWIAAAGRGVADRRRRDRWFALAAAGLVFAAWAIRLGFAVRLADAYDDGGQLPAVRFLTAVGLTGTGVAFLFRGSEHRPTG